jgi:hypothetical protein
LENQKEIYTNSCQFKAKHHMKHPHTLVKTGLLEQQRKDKPFSTAKQFLTSKTKAFEANAQRLKNKSLKRKTL